MLNNLIGIHVGPATLGEDPSIVDFIACVVSIGDIGLRLNNHILIIDLNVPNLTV